MSMKMKKTVFAAKKEFLITVDHYVSLGHRAVQATAENPGLAVLINNKYILRAGTIWKENGVALGLVADDYDLTDGDAQVAVVVHGFVGIEHLPVAPTADEMAQMSHILFFNGTTPVTMDKYLVEFTPVANATYTVEEGYRKLVNRGGSFAFKVTAASSKTVSKVEVNGEEVEADDDGVYTVEDISNDLVIVATIV